MKSTTFSAYIQLVRLDRPIGTFLLLWPTLWALWLAGNGSPEPDIVLVFVLGTVVMRAAGCIVNDYADRNLDPHVERTRHRPLASGTLSVTQALVLFMILMLIALALVLLLNPLTRYLSIVAVILAILYPFSKRVIWFPQCVLGLAFSMSIPMAYAALTESLPFQAWVLFLANLLWIIAYDTQYAMADRNDDLKAGIKSTAILFDKYDNLIIGLLHTAALTIIGLIGWRHALSWHFYLFLGFAGGFAVYQQYLCKGREPHKCLTAFFNNNWIGAMIYCGFVLGLMKFTTV